MSKFLHDDADHRAMTIPRHFENVRAPRTASFPLTVDGTIMKLAELFSESYLLTLKTCPSRHKLGNIFRTYAFEYNIEVSVI